MEKYLRMSDVFDMQPIRLPSSWSYEMVAHAVHAIDSHDELVAMNKDLLAALEAVAHCGRGSSGRIILDEFDEQCLTSAIAKAKGTA